MHKESSVITLHTQGEFQTLRSVHKESSVITLNTQGEFSHYAQCTRRVQSVCSIHKESSAITLSAQGEFSHCAQYTRRVQSLRSVHKESSVITLNTQGQFSHYARLLYDLCRHIAFTVFLGLRSSEELERDSVAVVFICLGSEKFVPHSTPC